MEIVEINKQKTNEDWVEYSCATIESGELVIGGSIALSNFPKLPEKGEIYYLIQDVQYIKGIALKLR